MTYNEWRDELKSNLLCVSESERRRVLDYYAEAYADRRDAGFTEREIIDDFGAPYDAAQRILSDRNETEYFEAQRGGYEETPKRAAREEKSAPPPPTAQPQYESRQNDGRYNQTESAPVQTKKREDYTWVFVLLCVIFCVPLFGVIMTMVGITISLFAVPFAVLISGVAYVGGGVGMMVGGDVAGGICTVGLGIIIFGISIVLIPLFIKLAGLMWKLFQRFFKWVKSLFSGKEATA